MKRQDAFFIVALPLLAAFVGHEAFEVKSAQLAATSTASFGSARVASVEPVSEIELPPPEVEPEEKIPESEAPSALIADVSRVLRNIEAADNTYLGEVLVARDSTLSRWPDRSTNPLRVWVQPRPKLAGFDPGFPPLVIKAFEDWAGTGIALSFTFVRDSSASDIRVTWVDRFDEQISGKTLWAHDQNWWIVDAQIQLALHHRSGEALDSPAVKAIALHEVGHLIGLDHTRDTMAIMTPRVRVKGLSEQDRATAQLLYSLPPGRVGKSAK
jgi:hypothetical protein